MKNERSIAKLKIYQQEKQHQFLREEHKDQRQEAAAAHDRLQQAKDKEIQLAEANAKLFALEVQALQLKIRYHELKKGDDAAN
jgi:hypothetical protein